jgi:hypothetical protein
VDIRTSSDIVQFNLSYDEAHRLCSAIAAGYDGVSRAEYYIRSGLSKPAVSDLVQAIYRALDAVGAELSLPLDAGIEDVENPKRPRPAS